MTDGNYFATLRTASRYVSVPHVPQKETTEPGVKCLENQEEMSRLDSWLLGLLVIADRLGGSQCLVMTRVEKRGIRISHMLNTTKLTVPSPMLVLSRSG